MMVLYILLYPIHTSQQHLFEHNIPGAVVRLILLWLDGQLTVVGVTNTGDCHIQLAMTKHWLGQPNSN